MGSVEFQQEQVIYSHYGAYISFTWRKNALLMQSMFGGLGTDDIVLFTLNMIKDAGEAISFKTHMFSDHLSLRSDAGVVNICITDDTTVRIHADGVGLRMTRSTIESEFDGAFSPDGKRWEINAYNTKIKAGLVTLRGQLTVNAPWNRVRSDDIIAEFLPDDDGILEAEIHLFESAWVPGANEVTNFKDAVQSAHDSFARWLDATLPVPEQWQVGRTLAAYTNWSAMVSPRGHYKRPAMLMSKNWMNKVWSWDNCFNALAHAEQDPQLAWDQIMLFFDHQDEHGAIPDHLTHSSMSFRFFKPPIHGWTLRKLMQLPDVITIEQIEAIYEPLARWTNWWFVFRDDDGDGFPQYNHGNESGWDNGTVFAEGVPVESPDLSAYLVIQMDVLADIATLLGKTDDSDQWKQRADELLTRMMAHFWNGEQFVAKHANSHEVVSGHSTLVFMPLLLGERLSVEVRQKTINALKRFITAYGVATEHPESDYYESDGYWRGPIWAPSTYILVEGLLACGEEAMALDISRKFCDMAQRSGMAENYDALTGDALRDRAYTWTASVFLLLGNLLLKKTV